MGCRLGAQVCTVGVLDCRLGCRLITLDLAAPQHTLAVPPWLQPYMPRLQP